MVVCGFASPLNLNRGTGPLHRVWSVSRTVRDSCEDSWDRRRRRSRPSRPSHESPLHRWNEWVLCTSAPASFLAHSSRLCNEVTPRLDHWRHGKISGDITRYRKRPRTHFIGWLCVIRWLTPPISVRWSLPWHEWVLDRCYGSLGCLY